VRLLWIEVRDFRSHHEVSLEVPPGLTVLVGPNAQGKTNLLEAMYYLCALASPRVSTDLPLVRHGAGSAYLRGEVETRGGRSLVEVEVRAGGQNRVQVNRSPVRRRRDLRRHVRAVFSGPDDLALVQGDPGERRRFMDESVAALWPARDTAPAAYERVLRQRNRLLKDWPGPGEPAGLAAWDEELIRNGTALTWGRWHAVEAVSEPAGVEFEALSGERLSVSYLPSVDGETAEAIESRFRLGMAERRADELVRRVTLVGPHRDDLSLMVQGMAARSFASHGEAWGAAVCLRLALAGAIQAEIGELPLTFLDDPFSALDPDRRRRLAGSLDRRGQVLVAVPEDRELLPGAAVWRLKEGRVVPD
jgi:DNA replication and repair protein RecF